MENNNLISLVQTFAVEKQTAINLQEAFAPFYNEANRWAEIARGIVVTDESQTEAMLQARDMRLKLRDIRVACDKKRKELKEDSLRYGKAVQGIYNTIEGLITPIESYLSEQEHYAEIQEQKRRNALIAERSLKLAPYISFVPSGIDLGALTDEDFDRLFIGAKLNYKQAEADRMRQEQERVEREKAEAAERERIRQENIRLQQETQRLQAELRAKEEAEKAEELRRVQEEALAPKNEYVTLTDRDKLTILAQDVASVRVPQLESVQANDILTAFLNKINTALEYLRTAAEENL